MKNFIKAIAWFIGYLIIQAIVSVGFIGINVVNGIKEVDVLSKTISNNILGIATISNIIFVVLAILICKFKNCKIKEKIKFKKVDITKYILPCIFALLFSTTYFVLTYNSNIMQTSPIYVGANYYGTLGIPILIISLLLVSPVVEEILFRGIILSKLKESFSVKASIILSAILFASIHIASGGIGLVIWAFVIGLILANVYEKTESIYVDIVIHAFANLPNLIIYFIPTISNMAKIILSLIFLTLTIITAIIWYNKSKKTIN